MLHQVLFTIFAAMALAGAINLLVQTHPINSALSLIVVMGALAAEYLLLGAEFISVIQVIVYAGAVMVLFVFVIMLLNAGAEEHSARGSRVAYIFGIPGVLAVAVLMLWILLRQSPASGSVPIGALYGGPADIGHLIFKPFLLPFEITSVLVLIAIMGAVVLARREN